ncbi:HlyD family secretion protein [Neisseria yangbaofengii]|uniref:HlyD family secretion protein n=1 Tax=Neisseria yangbaofengii TaxID=2709396 RepID=UPI0013EBCA1B|nr:HlyD family efflux transporter periplasmic adaptor subunit [Neisseria yangbaofengii]
MSQTPFFRPEVLAARENRWTGRIILTRPFSFAFLTGCACLIASAIVLFLIFGSYTEKTTVEGQLLPDSGVVRVYAPDSGVITEKFVNDGAKVKAGDKLFALSTSRFGAQGNIQERLVSEAALKKTLAEQELARLKLIHDNEKRSLEGTLNRLKIQHRHIGQRITGQKSRVRLAEEILRKYRYLSVNDAVSKQELMNVEAEMLEQRSKLDAYRSEEAGLLQEIQTQNLTLASLPERHKTEQSQLERAIADISQEVLDFKMRSEQIIRAGKTGYAATPNVEVGQQVDPTRLLMSIVPEQTELYASLYVPSKAAGFVKPNEKVVLRYQAYPYQKFGHAEGEIVSVAKTALGKQELSGLGLIFSNPALINEPAYLVKVKLKKQTVTAYGEEKPLQIGMTLEADILHGKKKLYEWVLDPIYSISGKLN